MEQQAFRKKLDRLWERGGKVSLACGRYEIEQSICVNTPCIRIDGESWSYSSDPNGVFESKYGTKLRLTKDIPAITVGVEIKETILRLPIQHNSDGTPVIDDTYKYSEKGYVPDWKFMEDYIKSLPYGDRL